MRVLEEIGIEFLNEEARAILKEAGCETTPGSTNVRMDRELVMEKVGLAPSQFTITPRNPERDGPIGGRTWCSSTCRARRTAPTSTAGGGWGPGELP